MTTIDSATGQPISNTWTRREESQLMSLVFSSVSWTTISSEMPTKSPEQCKEKCRRLMQKAINTLNRRHNNVQKGCIFRYVNRDVKRKYYVDTKNIANIYNACFPINKVTENQISSFIEVFRVKQEKERDLQKDFTEKFPDMTHSKSSEK